MAGLKTKVSLTVSVALIAAFYQLYVSPWLAVSGIYPNRVPLPLNNERCEAVKGLEACEKIVIHQPTGILYLACSSPQNRRLWLPYFDLLNPTGSGSDYIAQYNPRTKKVTRMKFLGLEPNKFSSHGMDVVTSSENPDELWFYLVNHRAPAKGDPKKVGADSVIQVFRGASPAVPGHASERLVWVKTYNSKHLHTPNDIVGSPDGKSFYWTNDHSTAVAWTRPYEGMFQRPVTNVGYCHEKTGCKVAVSGLVGANGIASNGNGTFYVASTAGWIQVLEEQKDHTFTLGERIMTDNTPVDNLALSADGALYAAGFLKMMPFVKTVFGADISPPSLALRVTKNTGQDAFFGHKYKVEKVFENDGSLMITSTSVAFDSDQKILYLHGIIAPHLLVCKF